MRFFNSALCATIAVSAASSACLAAETGTIYGGQSPSASGVAISSWGSGVVKETQEAVYSGAKSLKVTVHGMYQGARLSLAKPINFSDLLEDKAAYLEVVLKLSDKSAGAGGFGGPRGGLMGRLGGLGGGAGLSGPPGGLGGGGGGGRGGLGGLGGGMGGVGGAGGDTDTKYEKPKAIERLRIVISTVDGKRAEALLNLTDARKNAEGWKFVSIPVASLAGLKGGSGVNEVSIFGDSTTTFFLGEIRTVRDTTPIILQELTERTIAVNDTISFSASADAGVTPVIYEWTFSDVNEKMKTGASPLPVDNEGRTVKHQFRKEGEYQVFVTARDPNGLKKPVTKSTTVKVTL